MYLVACSLFSYSDVFGGLWCLDAPAATSRGPGHELGQLKKRKKRTKKTQSQKHGKKTRKKHGGGCFSKPRKQRA